METHRKSQYKIYDSSLAQPYVLLQAAMIEFDAIDVIGYTGVPVAIEWYALRASSRSNLVLDGSSGW